MKDIDGTKIINVNLTDLYLWSENPRYNRLGKEKVSDDVACTEKFQNHILESIEKDVIRNSPAWAGIFDEGFVEKGEILAYKHKGKIIVGDGNNRLASAKIIVRDKETLKKEPSKKEPSKKYCENIAEKIESFKNVSIRLFVGKNAKDRMRKRIHEVHVEGAREWSSTSVWTEIYELWSSGVKGKVEEANRLSKKVKNGKDRKLWFQALRIQKEAFSDKECRSMLEKGNKDDYLSFFYEFAHGTGLKEMVQIDDNKTKKFIGNMKEFRNLVRLYTERDKNKPRVPGVVGIRRIGNVVKGLGNRELYESFKKGEVSLSDITSYHNEMTGGNVNKKYEKVFAEARSLTRNISITANVESILKDMKLTRDVLIRYINKLEKLHKPSNRKVAR